MVADTTPGESPVTAAELWRLTGRAFVPYMDSLPDGVGRIDDKGWIALSGAALPSVNMAYVADTPGAGDALASFVAMAAERGLPLTVLMPPMVSDRLSEAAADLGVEPADSLPILAMRPDGRTFGRRDDPRYEIVRAERLDELAGSLDVQAETFRMSRDAVGRVYGPSMLSSAVFEVFTATRDGEPVSTVTTATIGRATGIWSMATLPDRQRQGAGGAVFAAALAHHAELGVEVFYLAAGGAGRAMYEQAGFVELEDTRLWVTV